MPTAKDSLDELKSEAIEDELNKVIKNSDYDGKKAKKIRDIASRYHHPDRSEEHTSELQSQR